MKLAVHNLNIFKVNYIFYPKFNIHSMYYIIYYSVYYKLCRVNNANVLTEY